MLTQVALALLVLVSIVSAVEKCTGANQVWKECTELDPKTCRNKATWKHTGCNIAYCECKDGYVRDDDWNCVKESDCPTKFECADANEEMKACSTRCEPTCANRNPVCTADCGPKKCQCKKGYARDMGRCIDMKQCPQHG